MSTSFRRALLIGCLGNGVAALVPLVIFRDPPGSAIRPMDIPLYLLVVELVTVVRGLYAVGAAVKELPRYWPAGVALGLFCLAPLFTGVVSFHLLVEAFDYTLKP